jgi:hypothetical protein
MIYLFDVGNVCPFSDTAGRAPSAAEAGFVGGLSGAGEPASLSNMRKDLCWELKS